ncbi:hypothetical protein [Neptuniibacter sp. QD37_11]|uniref:hypothetical protein n=1 Tax=Neptuniibacter sp. QD37_11 TaxID=3398209 RepID=UPI0039F64712
MRVSRLFLAALAFSVIPTAWSSDGVARHLVRSAALEKSYGLDPCSGGTLLSVDDIEFHRDRGGDPVQVQRKRVLDLVSPRKMAIANCKKHGQEFKVFLEYE